MIDETASTSEDESDNIANDVTSQTSTAADRAP
jgi:hypothetical protein